jgi:hypothetical protein
MQQLMRFSGKPAWRRGLLACLLCGCSLAVAAGQDYRQTKTPYVARQNWHTLEPAPTGYQAVFTQLLARHGSRGLTGMKTDLALYRLWQQAQQDDALTPLGRELGPAIMALMRANALLGYGEPGISKPGYGNETRVGVQEQNGLAQRMQQRMSAVFRNAGSRQIVVLTSGKDRAVDSGAAFVDALLDVQPGLRPALVYPAAPADSRMAAGTNLFMLYFHRLPKTAPADPALLRTWSDSQAYQAYKKSAALQAQLQRLGRDPSLQSAADAVLQPLLTTAFLQRLQQGQYRFSNNGVLSFQSADGKFTNTLTGDQHTVISNGVDASRALYDLYAIAAGMREELRPQNQQENPASEDFSRFMPQAAAQAFAQAEDAEDFYTKGPGLREQGDVTYRMAGILLDDFFSEADAIDRGDLRHAAKLRFAHAEIVVPLAALLGLPDAAQQASQSQPYDYRNNRWRGAEVAPMAANLQWDMFADQNGHTLVRLLYNEAEQDFKPACDSARIVPHSHFYDYHALRSCYGR